MRGLAGFPERAAAKETFCDYAERLYWIRENDDGRVELSAVGRALLKALNTPVMDEQTADVFEVVLSPDNPFAYAQALGGLSRVKDALLVEPYFRLEQLMDVRNFDNIVRVMVGKLNARDVELLATGLAALPEERTLEIRKAPDLHDRYLIPSGEGRVLMLGASLNGIGRNVSTMTTLGDVASRALRDAHEDLWRSAERIEPKVSGAAAQAVVAATAEVEKADTKKAPSRKTITKKATAKKATTGTKKSSASK